MRARSERRNRRISAHFAALVFFVCAGVLEATHGYIGYGLMNSPLLSYTLDGQDLSFLDVLARAMPSWIVLGLLAGSALRVARYRPLFSTPWPAALVLHVPVAIAFTAIFLIGASAFRHYLFVGPQTGLTYTQTLLRYYTLFFNTFFLWYWAIVGVYSAFLQYRDLREREVQAATLERQLSEARLQALQQQLEPHFLFNTLNAVSGLALEGNVPGTVRTLALLGELLRETLRKSEQVVTFSKELQLLSLYLEIQQIRLEERLQVRMAIDEAVMSAEVPTFLLQPIIENAIRHGISHDSDPGWIEIEAKRVDHRIRVTIVDSGPGIGDATPRLGVGLNNSISRLTQLYGGDASLRLSNAEGGGAHVQMEWPFRLLETAGGLPAAPGTTLRACEAG